jgi:hypothetical protein
MMPPRLGLVAALVVGLYAAPLVADAQPPSEVARIGYLESGSAAPGTPYVEAFRHGLATSAGSRVGTRGLTMPPSMPARADHVIE